MILFIPFILSGSREPAVSLTVTSERIRMPAFISPSPIMLDAVAALSREVALAVARTGEITWADERAARLLGMRPGTPLTALAYDGGAEKVARLVDAASQADVERWEVLFAVAGQPVAVAFRGRPHDGGAALVGSLVAQDYGALLAQMSESMSELATLQRETERQKGELTRANRALDDSSRGMVALYSELNEKSDSLRVANEVKSRFVANISHELRTPLNSILGLSKLLLSRADGDLTSEQEKQIGFMRRSAESLSEIVNDLLDIAKLEAGKLVLRPTAFEVADVLGALRGMLRPLVTSDAVELVVEDPGPLPRFETDEGKLSQVLRNFVSNALKFTERGEVRVTARDNGDGTATFTVRDTGIGIARADRDRIFEEFGQVANPLQDRVKGTGLGLSVSQKLATLLGGHITLESELGEGSAFSLVVPYVHPEAAAMTEMAERSREVDPARSPVLVVEDDRQTLFLYEKYLAGSGFQVLPARTLDEARTTLRRLKPAAIVLDVMLEGETTWRFLEELKASEATRHIPTLVVTVTDREQKARALGADEFFVKPLDRDWLLRRLRHLAKKGPVEKVLVIDDDEVARYLVRKMLVDTPYTVLEAADGPEGVRKAREDQPQAIILDFVLPNETAFEVLDELKGDLRTRRIPVIVSTSKTLDDDERRRLAADTAAILSKQTLSREIAIARIREALEKAVVA